MDQPRAKNECNHIRDYCCYDSVTTIEIDVSDLELSSAELNNLLEQIETLIKKYYN